MTNDIQKRIMAGKNKSIILKKGGTTAGVTNAVNPTSLKKLSEAFEDIEVVRRTPIIESYEKPKKVLPNIEVRYRTIASELGVCPYELKAIMNAELNGDETLIFTILKKYVAAVKLCGVVDLAPVHKKLKNSEEAYKLELRRWDAHEKRARASVAENRSKFDRAQKEFGKVWCGILIDLITKLDRNNDISELGMMDRYLVMAINLQSEEACQINGNIAALDFNKCKNIPTKIVSELPAIAQEIRESEIQIERENWLFTAPIEDLLTELWNLDIQDDRSYEAYDIESAIAERSGKTPIYDHRGNICWNATFSDEEWTDKYRQVR